MLKLVREWKMASAALVAASVLMAGCSGDDADPVPPPATVTLQGSVVQGPVSGARVFADRAPFNNRWDAGEEFAFTASDGSYNFPAVDGDFRLCTEGGIDTLANQPAYQMIAPKDAANVTPLTTLVALAPTPAAAGQIMTVLNNLAGVPGTTGTYDLDPTQGIPVPLLTLIKSVEATLEVFASNFGVTDQASQQTLMATIGAQLVAAAPAAGPIADPTAVLQTALAAAVEVQIEGLSGESYELPVGESRDALVSALSGEISTMVNNISQTVASAPVDGNGNVSETTTLQEQVSQNIADSAQVIANDPVYDVIPTYSVSISTFQVRNSTDADLDSNPDPAIITVSASEAAKIVIDLLGINTFTVDKGASNVSVQLLIDDANSSRMATFTLSGLDVTVGPGGIISYDDSAAVLTAIAIDSAGNTIATRPVNGPFESINFASNSVTFDLPAIQQLLADQVSADFGVINKVGSYDVAGSISGIAAKGKAVRLNAN